MKFIKKKKFKKNNISLSFYTIYVCLYEGVSSEKSIYMCVFNKKCMFSMQHAINVFDCPSSLFLHIQLLQFK